jgi:hypothetical protein
MFLILEIALGVFFGSTIKTVRVRIDEVENYRLEFGDVLMTEGGDLDKLGRNRGR